MDVPRLAETFPRTRIEPDFIYAKDGKIYTTAGVTAVPPYPGRMIRPALVPPITSHSSAFPSRSKLRTRDAWHYFGLITLTVRIVANDNRSQFQLLQGITPGK